MISHLCQQRYGNSTQGNLQLVDASTGSVIGYVGKDWNIFGEFESTTDVSAALVVSIDLVVAAAGQTDIATIVSTLLVYLRSGTD